MPKGGARPGAGRKPKPKLPFAPKEQATHVLSYLGTEYKGKKLPTRDDIWLTLILSDDPRIRLDSMKYLTDRDEGKPVQPLVHRGDETRPIRIVSKIERPKQ